MRLGVEAALVDGEIVPGDVVVDEGRVAQVGASPGGRSGLAVPGFIDLQVNGFASHDFASAGGEGLDMAALPLAATGVTAYQPTLVTSPPEIYPHFLAAVGEARTKLTAPRILGAHLEGPFLSPEFAGAHDHRYLAEPDVELVADWMKSGPLTEMTLAPELAGALELVEYLARQGVTVSIGHTGADTATAHLAFDRGARTITHIHNAHRRWSHRDPGPGGVALARPGVVVRAIVDGVHLAPEAAYATFLAARGRFALVTDAIAAAGLGDGQYRLGDQTITVEDGVARRTDGTLAGSVVTMDQEVRNLVHLGASMVESVEAASRVPARLVGRPELGTLQVGTPADIVVLDDRYEVASTFVGGTRVFER